MKKEKKSIFNSPICMKAVNVDIEWLLTCERLISKFARLEDDVCVVDNTTALKYLLDYTSEWLNCIKSRHYFCNKLFGDELSSKPFIWIGFISINGEEYNIIPIDINKDKITFQIEKRKYDK